MWVTPCGAQVAARWSPNGHSGRRVGPGSFATVPDLPILTERLKLRLFDTSDFDDFHRVFADPEVVRYLLWEPLDRGQAGERLQDRLVRTSLAREGDILWLAIEERSTGVGQARDAAGGASSSGRGRQGRVGGHLGLCHVVRGVPGTSPRPRGSLGRSEIPRHSSPFGSRGTPRRCRSRRRPVGRSPGACYSSRSATEPFGSRISGSAPARAIPIRFATIRFK